MVDITSFMGRYSIFETGKRVFVLQQKDKTTNRNIDYFADLLEDLDVLLFTYCGTFIHGLIQTYSIMLCIDRR